MLRVAADLASAGGLADVRLRVRNLVSSDLSPSHVGLALLDGLQVRRVPDPETACLTEMRTPVFPLDSPLPSARAARNREIVVLSDRSALEAEYGPAATAGFDEAGLQTAVCVPLPGTRGTLGVLVFGWATPQRVDVTERAVLTAIAGYTAQAVERALYLDERITVARQLQQAMLTDLPVVPGLQLAASYRPAAAGELVGGDWYDAYPLRPTAPAGREQTGQADLHDTLGPAAAVTAVEEACEVLSLNATGTLVHGHLYPVGDTAAWRLTWTNAGHPPLLLGHRGG